MDGEEQEAAWGPGHRAGEEGSPGSAPEGADPGGHAAESAPVRRRRGRAQQRALLEALEATGEDEGRFCARLGIQAATLARWRRDVERRGRGGVPANAVARRLFTPEERRAAVEAFVRSGRSREDFARLWGCSASSLDVWRRAYGAGGPKALEPRPRRRRELRAQAGAEVEPAHDADDVGAADVIAAKYAVEHEPEAAGAAASGVHPRLADAVRDAVADAKAEHPDFGLRRVRDYLLRFCGIRVSAGSVRNILLERGVEPGPVAPRRAVRTPPLPRRFERARPGDLWQSDITSFVLRRERVRVYLTVFLDDHSRYVVAWKLATRQTADLVIDPLLEGIARFGKPREVLTDQGRQYYAWRGKSAFQKLLAKEGIQHVVSRAHHPQTLGKCERLWKSVGEEFWDRAVPSDIDDARRRLAHYFAHYNHFRPHQGIGGLVPADRFFGAESALREAIAREVDAQSLRLAIEKAPRRPVYLVGQIGASRVSVHGERGLLVVQQPDGTRRELALCEPGAAAAGDESRRNIDDGDDDRASGAGRRDGDRERRDEAAQEAHGTQAHALPDPAATGAGGEGPLALGERGAAEEGAHGVRGDPRVLAREALEAGGGEGARGAAAPGVAALADRGVGDAGGALEAAAGAARSAAQLRGAAGGRPEDPAEEDPGARDAALADGGLGAGLADGAVGVDELRRPCGDGASHRTREEGRCSPPQAVPARTDLQQSGGDARSPSASRSDGRTARIAALPRRAWRWLRRTE